MEKTLEHILNGIIKDCEYNYDCFKGKIPEDKKRNIKKLHFHNLKQLINTEKTKSCANIVDLLIEGN